MSWISPLLKFRSSFSYCGNGPASVGPDYQRAGPGGPTIVGPVVGPGPVWAAAGRSETEPRASRTGPGASVDAGGSQSGAGAQETRMPSLSHADY